MRVLAFDAAANHSSAAVVGPESVIAEVSTALDETHSRNLMKNIHRVVSDCRLTISDLDGFAVTRGPGSFTGLRIALSTAKGLSVATGKPVAAISTLDVLAFQGSSEAAWIIPMLDARKNEVYFSRFHQEAGNLVRVREESVGPLESAVSGIMEPCLFIGEGAFRYQNAIHRILGDLALFPPQKSHPIRASVTGFLGMTALKKGRAMEPELLVPIYIRGADVRIALGLPGFIEKESS